MKMKKRSYRFSNITLIALLCSISLGCASTEPSISLGISTSLGLSSTPSTSSAPSTLPAVAPTSSSTPSLPLCATSAPWTSVLLFYGLTPDCLLPECAGHCNSDLDCATDLFCYRPGNLGMTDSVPGCETVPYRDVNYCVANDLKLSSPPSELPTMKPSSKPSESLEPSEYPTMKPSSTPSYSLEPSFLPSNKPSAFPSHSPTISISPTVTMAPTKCSPAWKQLGNPIDTPDNFFAMATDRLVVAVGKDESIHVYSFDSDSASWIQIAEPIDTGMVSERGWGFSLALSSEGDVVAFGDRIYFVKIFALHPDNFWAQAGQTIEGEKGSDRSGWSLDISADGATVAIGAPHNNGNGYFSGHVRVYKYSWHNQQWIQKGHDIDGELVSDNSGIAVSMSRDAAVLAIGAYHNNGNGPFSGQTRVYRYDADNLKWMQLGRDLDGEAEYDRSGVSVAMSGDGSTVAIGADSNDGNGYNAGHVRVYRLDRTNNNWIQKGRDIDGEAEGDSSADTVDISDDGTSIVIGAINNDGAAERWAGHLRTYRFDTLEGDWVQQGADLDGDDKNDRFGNDVSISGDGTVVGATGLNTDNLKISKLTSCTTPPPSPMPSIPPNCAAGNHTLRLDITTDRFPHQTTWEVTNFEEETVLRRAPYKERFTFHSESYCLDQGCYRWTIRDSSSDGVCCDWFTGNSEYKLFFDSDLIKEGGNFTSEESSIQFGLACPSSVPSISLSPSISSRPSSSPSRLSDLCPIGTFPSNTNSSRKSRCAPCPPGTYQNVPTRSETCRKCEAGTHQPEEGKSSCLPCKAGTYQVAVGQTKCDQCRGGGFCGTDLTGTCDGGFKPCRAGTYNNRTGQYNETACLPCPAGKYGDKDGLIECLPCPFRLGSYSNSTVCSFCNEGFYLQDPNTNTTELLKRPDDSCLPCPDNTECAMNTTLETLNVLPNFWRDSLQTASVYPCKYDGVCVGGNAILRGQSSRAGANLYCKGGHSGPLCETCEKGRYMNPGRKECCDCPTFTRLIVIMATIIAICIVMIVGYFAAVSSAKGNQCFISISNKVSCIGLQAKVKIIISFYQVFNGITTIYGVKIVDFKAWFNFLSLFNFRLLHFVMPKQCFGSLKVQIILSSTWPFILLAVLALGMILHAMRLKKISGHSGKLIELAIFRSMHYTIIMVYVLLPSVSDSIFDAIRCRSFVTNDNNIIESSYLLEDLSIRCDKSDNRYTDLQRTFWVLFTVWPVIMPLLFAGLLWYIRKSVRSYCSTDLSEACRFLWRDYHNNMIFWEVLDILRKIILKGLIMFVGKEQGAERILRLVIAISLSTIYLGLLALARPYKRMNDLYLSFMSNILLICCFLAGIVIHTCNRGEVICKGFIGLTDSRRATILVVVLTGGLLILSIIIIFVLARTTTPTPTILVSSTSSSPNLEMSDTCHFHVFLSHVWSTGQDKTHNVARMLQLYLPGIRIWLDVDELNDVGVLEKSVSDSELFILFYSIGYFKSSNCRREISAAVKNNKKILILYEGDESSIETMKLECATLSETRTESDQILRYTLREDPIRWLGGSARAFSQMSVKLVVLRLLHNLPYYCQHTTELNRGLKLGNTLHSSKFTYPQEILVCKDNVGIIEIVDEFEEKVRNKVSIIDEEVDVISQPGSDVTKVMLLYLNNKIFQNKDGIVHQLVSESLANGIQIILIEEKDASKGQCDFNQLIHQTPKDLVLHGLFSSIAIPLYTSAEYRSISLYLVQKKISDLCSSKQNN